MNPLAASTTAQRPGQGPWFSCDFDNHWWRRDCQGAAPFNLFDPGRRYEATEWLDRRTWDAVKYVLRDSLTKAEGTLQMIAQPQKMPLEKLNKRGTVIAKIDLDPDGPAVLKYRIGGDYTRGKGFTRSFYIIITKFQLEPNPAKDKLKASVKIANWRIFGTGYDGELRALEAQGAFRWCYMPSKHSVVKAVFFADCVTRHRLMEIERLIGSPRLMQLLARGKALTTADFAGLSKEQIATIEYAVRIENDAPASLPCGVGCCFTDFEF